MKSLYLLTDEELVQQYANGVNLAFEILLNRHKTFLYSYIYCTVYDRELTEDIFQETFVKAIYTIKSGKYEDIGKFKSWLLQIAHNLLIDHFRKENLHKVIFESDMTQDIRNFSGYSARSVEDDMIRSQTHKNIRMMITYLPSKQREVVEMRIYYNMTFKEIACTTGVTISTALARMRYAVNAMRKMMKKQEKQVYLS